MTRSVVYGPSVTLDAGNNKWTNLADGVAADDAATVGQATASGIPATILDAKGDLIVASAADTAARLAVGSNGQVLTADSGETTGAKWATPSSGGGSKIYLNKPAANITRASATLGALSTAWQITSVVVASGQNVKLTLDASANDGNTNNDVIFGLVRGSTLLASRIFNISATNGNVLKAFTLAWVDENPGADTYTYEIYGAVFGGATLTVYQTTVTTDTAGGNSVFLAEVYTP